MTDRRMEARIDSLINKRTDVCIVQTTTNEDKNYLRYINFELKLIFSHLISQRRKEDAEWLRS